MICKALKQKYPDIEVIGTVGPFHYPSSDYMEGWKIAKENRQYIDAVDEHYYENQVGLSIIRTITTIMTVACLRYISVNMQPMETMRWIVPWQKVFISVMWNVMAMWWK